MRRDPKSTAGAAVIDLLLASPEFVALVAAEEIDRQVAAGTLLRTDQLRQMPLEFVPAGTTDRLRHLLRQVVENGAKKLPADLLGTISAAIAGEPAPAEPEPEPATDEPAATPETAEDAHDEPAPAADEARRPSAMPVEPGTCEQCGGSVDLTQAQLSWTRFRKVLCREDQATHKKTAA